MKNRVVGSLTLACMLIPALGGMSAPPPDPYVQIVELEQVRYLGNGRLAQFVNSGDRTVAVRAALAIGRTKQAAGIPLLEAHLHDSDTAMRAMAVYGIGLIGGSAAAGPVLRGLKDSSAAVRVAALDGTIRLEAAHAFDAPQARASAVLTESMLSHASPVLRSRAATTLAAYRGTPLAEQALSALTNAYAHESDGTVRWHIMWTIYRAYAKEVPERVLARGLRDGNEIVRIEAVRAFGRRHDTDAVALLQPLTEDPSWRVQEQTLESINVLKGGQMTQHLKSIPSVVHTPAPQPDRFANLPALPRTPAPAKNVKPEAQNIITRPRLDPSTVALITGPASGPHPRVRIVTTKGNVYLELYPEWAPLTVENFLNLANDGYYDGNPWFRIVPDFVDQTGDDPDHGKNGPGYTIPAEENPIEQDSYIVSMGLDYTNPPNAHAIRDSAGSEFYITLSPQLHLNQDFSVFGRVIGGADVLGRLVESDKIVRIERIADSAQ